MSVLVLSDTCNLSCDYCFYSTVMAKKREEMLWKDNIYFNKDEAIAMANRMADSEINLDLNKRSIVITGWEPTMHPEFIEIMTYFIRKDFEIHLLSNFVFPPNWPIAKFLKKHKAHFRFLVNFNEIGKQRASIITKQNLIALNYEHIKIGVNLYHPDFNFTDIIEVLEQAPNIKTIRLWLPNAQADEGINRGVMMGMQALGIWEDKYKDLYTQDLFERDLNHIIETWKGLPYGILDKVVYEYYKYQLGGALLKFIHLLEEKNLDERVDFYVDCGFDYKILPKEALGFIMQRLHYKNPCSIPNGVCMQVNGNTQQCYAIGDYGNIKGLNIKNFSLREVNNFYLLSALLLQHGFLNQIEENKLEMCRGNNLRFFKQLFTKGTFNRGEFVLKDYNISQNWDEKVGYMLKDIKEMLNRYFNAFKQTKQKVLIIRIMQLFEYCLAHLYLNEAQEVLSDLKGLEQLRSVEDSFKERIRLYDILFGFIKENVDIVSNWNKNLLENLKNNYIERLQREANYIRENNKGIIKDYNKNLYSCIKLLVNKWVFLKPKN